jgi:hypothetical protein
VAKRTLSWIFAFCAWDASKIAESSHHHELICSMTKRKIPSGVNVHDCAIDEGDVFGFKSRKWASSLRVTMVGSYAPAERSAAALVQN